MKEQNGKGIVFEEKNTSIENSTEMFDDVVESLKESLEDAIESLIDGNEDKGWKNIWFSERGSYIA